MSLSLRRLMAPLAGMMLAFTVLSTAWSAPHLALDLESGKVLSHKHAFDPWHPASLTKLMTAYVAFRAIDDGEITAKSPVRISKNARRQPPSRMGYRVGTVLNMENALTILVIKSANDVSVAIAESISGSVPLFASRMNREARRLGMTGSRFVNPHGLHNARQITTAHDMAILVRAIHQEFPQYATLFTTPSLQAPKRVKGGKLINKVHYSYNLLLERFRGADGFKTGFVCASGYNFIGAATRSGRRIAAIVLGRDSQTSRAVDAARLLTEGFQTPLTQGTDIANLKPDSAVPSNPRNLRPEVCSQEARAKRYDPGAGLAVIDSPWLSAREISTNRLKVVLGDATGPISVASAQVAVSRVPVPKPRPTFKPLTPIAGIRAAQAGRIALPSFRPLQTTQ